MTPEDCSLCMSCAYSERCSELTDNLVAYECDAYEPKGEEDGQSL